MSQNDTPLLEVNNLSVHFRSRSPWLFGQPTFTYALNDISINANQGEIVGIVGESGCGKSTLCHSILRLNEPTEGTISFQGQELTKLKDKDLRAFRKDIQIVFQDPLASLNPRMTIGSMLSEAMTFHQVVPADKVDERAAWLLELCGLNADALRRFPHEFSGGQRQRIGIARALSVSPKLLIADEPVSALDTSIQAQLLNLLYSLKREFDLTILFISHDMKVVEHFCDRIYVMYCGSVVEHLPAGRLKSDARHPYTQGLLEAIPVDHPNDRRDNVPISGEVPSPHSRPTGCSFASRCPLAVDSCAHSTPSTEQLSLDHQVACPVVIHHIR
jgi:oligopeptide/dipeptide ABC transporter ATP-binding protein